MQGTRRRSSRLAYNRALPSATGRSRCGTPDPERVGVGMDNVSLANVAAAMAFVLLFLSVAWAWMEGRLARVVVLECGRRESAHAELEVKWLEAGRRVSMELREYHDKQWHKALVAAKAARDQLMIELSEPILSGLESTIGDGTEKFTCDGCDSVYRRHFPGYVRWYGLEFCSEECRRNPLPFDAPAITVVTALAEAERLMN